jgi:hypothetical protein
MKMKTTPRLDSKIEAETLAFLESETMNSVAAYLAKGRACRHLSQDELISEWMRAFEGWRTTPPILSPASAKGALRLKSDCGGSEPPYEAEQTRTVAANPTSSPPSTQAVPGPTMPSHVP